MTSLGGFFLAGTNVGAVYLDLRLDVKELQRGLGDVERDVGLLGSVFGRLQGDILRIFSNQEFAPVFRTFGELGEGMQPVRSGLGGLWDGFDRLVRQVPDFTQRLRDNVGAQGMAEGALGRLAGRTGDFERSVDGMINRLGEVPFGQLEQSAGGFGTAIEGLTERSGVFSGRWREVMLGAREYAQETGRGFERIFGGDIPGSWRGMLGCMEGGWSNAWTGMKQAFGGIINRIIGGLNNMIGGLNRFQVNLPDWMGGGRFGFNIPKIPLVPALARGGIVDAPTLALVGERGREAVLPLENNTGWMADLANVLAEAVAANQAYARPYGEARVNLYMDGAKLAEGIVDDLRHEVERRDLKLFWS